MAAMAACVLGSPARAAQPQYEFLAAPQINLSLVYRLDKLTGDVIACQFAHNRADRRRSRERSGSRPAIAAATGRRSRSPATMGSSPPGTSRKAACSGSTTAPARSASATSISSAKSRATTRRSPINMSSARRNGTADAGPASACERSERSSRPGGPEAAIAGATLLAMTFEPRGRPATDFQNIAILAMRKAFARRIGGHDRCIARSRDTIFAPASGVGRAAIAVLRISGPGCRPRLKRLRRAANSPTAARR